MLPNMEHFFCAKSLECGTTFCLQASKMPRSRNAYFFLTKEKNPIAIHLIIAKDKVDELIIDKII